MNNLTKEDLTEILSANPEFKRLQAQHQEQPVNLLQHLWHKYFYPAMFDNKKVELIELSLIDFAKMMEQAQDFLKDEILHKGTLRGAVVKMNPTLPKGVMLVKVGEQDDPISS
jgi:hypothetical protein